MQRFKMIASGYVLFIRNRKILLSRRYRTGYKDGYYSLPAGHIEDNEPMKEGTCREIKEETGVRIKPADISLVHVMHRKENDIRMDFFFLARIYKGEPKNAEPEKCDDIRWFPVDSLPGNTIPYIRAAIGNYRTKVFYSQFGWK
jgi:8-oxo-dGTP diphosphatase